MTVIAIALLLLAKADRVISNTPEPIQFAIEPNFADAGDFSNGLARVGIGKITNPAYGWRDIENYGYINRQGKMVIPPQFKQAGDFAEGLAWVGSDSDGDGAIDLYGFIDQTGKQVIKPAFTEVGSFSEGLARVTLKEQRGYIDKTGKLVLKLKYPYLTQFHEGLARVGIDTKTGGFKYGYINRKGKLVIPFKFSLSGHFSQGLAATTSIDTRTLGYINKRGKLVLKIPQLDTYVAGEFKEGFAVVELNGGSCSAAAYCEYRFINRRGKVVLKPPSGSWTGAGHFAAGLAPVATTGGGRDAGGFYAVTGWGFINDRGKYVIPPQFEDAGSFSEGLARVQVDGKYGYIPLPK